METYIAALTQKLEKWSRLGVRRYSDGTMRIGRLTERAAEAYLHSLYGPLSADECEMLEEMVNQPIPRVLKQFYLSHNGCNLFRGSLVVFGLRRSYDRSDFDAMACNPFDLVVPAVTYKDKSPSGQGLCICTYQDKSPVFIEPDGKVVRTTHSDSHRLNRWSSFEHWIVSEVDRINRFFDASGYSSSPLSQTVPLPELTH
jgi:hypothetical protein